MDYPQYIVEEEVFQEEIEKGSLTVTCINSTVAFLIAYLLVYLIFQLSTIFIASFFQIETNWFYYKLNFLAVTMSPLWHFLSVRLIFSAGPVVSFFMSFVYFAIYYAFLRNRKGLLKLVLLWATLHSFNMFFGQFIGGVVAFQFQDKFLGFLYVTNWMFLSKELSEILGLGSLIIMLTIGYFSAYFFLSTAYSRYFLFNNRMKFSFKVNAVFLPALLGTIFIFFMKLPVDSMEETMEFLSYNVYELITYAVMLLTLIPVFSNYNTQLDLSIQIAKEKDKQRVSWGFLMFGGIMWVVFRVILDPNLGMGLHFFGMENGFDIDTFLKLKGKL